MRRYLALILFALAPAASALAPTPAASEGDTRPAAKRVCFSQAETREQIKAQRLREPYAVLRYAAQHFKAEALSAKLCRIDDEMVYEIALLHKDGKYFHAHVSAVSGKLIDYKRPAAPPPKT